MTDYLDGLTDEQLQVGVDLLRASVRINRELIRDDDRRRTNDGGDQRPRIA